VRKAYTKREVEYPVDFIMDMTMGMMRYNPDQALSGLVRWANQRYNLGWDEAKVRSTMPPKIREEVLAASRKFVESGEMDKSIEAIVEGGDPAVVEQRLKDRFGSRMPAWIKDLEGEARLAALRGAAEMAIRGELAQFERLILVETLDSSWKDHLYSMDQLRDSIGFRAFSQQDPRIEYKREGAKQFTEMNRHVRDRVCEQVFKMKISPTAAIQQQMAAMAMQQRAQQSAGAPLVGAGAPAGGQPRSPRPMSAGGTPPQSGGAMPFGGGTFAGPGISMPSPARPPQPQPPASTPPPPPPPPPAAGDDDARGTT
jgi:preprotein translocase subunit SecA